MVLPKSAAFRSRDELVRLFLVPARRRGALIPRGPASPQGNPGGWKNPDASISRLLALRRGGFLRRARESLTRGGDEIAKDRGEGFGQGGGFFVSSHVQCSLVMAARWRAGW